MIQAQTHHSQTTCAWINYLTEASLSLSFSSKMAIMGKLCIENCSNKRYCERYKTWDFQCCISLIRTVSTIECLVPCPTWAWRLIIFSCRKATGQAFCFSRYFGGPAGYSGNRLHIRNPDSHRPSSFHYRRSNTRKRNRTGFARQMKKLASVCSYFPTAALRFPPATPVSFPTVLFLPQSPLACSSALGCLCHFRTGHSSDMPSPLILFYVLAKWRHNSPWQSLEHPEHWLTPKLLFNLDGSLY